MEVHVRVLWNLPSCEEEEEEEEDELVQNAPIPRKEFQLQMLWNDKKPIGSYH